MNFRPKRRSSPFPYTRSLIPVSNCHLHGNVKALRTLLVDNLSKNISAEDIIREIWPIRAESIQSRQGSHDQSVQSIQIEFTNVQDAQYCFITKPFGYNPDNFSTSRLTYNILHPVFSPLWTTLPRERGNPAFLWHWRQPEKEDDLLSYAIEQNYIIKTAQ